MKHTKTTALLLVLLMALTCVFSACKTDGGTTEPTDPTTKAPTNPTTGGNDTTTPTQPEEIPQALANINAVLENFPMIAQNDSPSISGGVLRYALVSSSPFKGLFDPLLYADASDSTAMGFMVDDFLSTDENLTFSQQGLCTYTYDIDARTVTITQAHETTWHDGEPVTLDDLLFAYEIVCHPDYTGVRYDDSYMNIVGAEEYHAGEAATISGITLSADERTMTIEFIEFYPSILIAGFNSSGVPRHYYEGVAVAELESSPQVRERPIGFGPFKIRTIVPGESVEYVRNDDYWMGAPKLDGIIVQVIESAMVPTAMEEGLFDIADFSTQQYNDYQNPTNYTYLSDISRAYNYTGFRLGTYNQETGKCETDMTMKMGNVNLRKAIAYAVDNLALTEQFYNGLRFPATSIICPFHMGYLDFSVPGYLYDPDEAMRLLDEAGYIDIDGDGFREDPNGDQLTITWAFMEGEGADIMAKFKIQCWEDVGLRVELYNGRLTEFNAFYDMLEFDTDNKELDMYDGAWQVGYDPDPAGIWGPNAVFNMTRYTSPTLQAIFDNIQSEKAWDEAYREEQYSAFQYAFHEEIPAVATQWRLTLVAVNNRVKNFSLVRMDGVSQVSLGASHLWELTADQIIKK